MVTYDSFLGIQDCHVFVTEAAGEMGTATVVELLGHGCTVTAFDKHPFDVSTASIPKTRKARLFPVVGHLGDDGSVARAFQAAVRVFGPPHILVANAAVVHDSSRSATEELDVNQGDEANPTTARGIATAINHFLVAARAAQDPSGKELPDLSIVVTSPEADAFASDKAVLPFGLEGTARTEMARLNVTARINAVAYRNSTASTNVARSIAFMASYRVAGRITGQCIRLDSDQTESMLRGSLAVPERKPRRQRRMRIAISLDFDAVSGYLGTGYTPQNTLSDYSAGVFSANVGVNRVLKVLQKHGISKDVTWFLPGHSIESFPTQTKAIVESGAEIGIHGYSHEGASAMTVQQEREVLEKCIELGTRILSGKRPSGYRAPLYQIRASTINLLQEHGFLYDSSLNAHDSLPYLLPKPYPEQGPHAPDYSRPASTGMVPFAVPEAPAPDSPEADGALVEIPASWYAEDMTPLIYYPYSSSTQGYVSVEVVEKMWWDRFEWVWENECWLDQGEGAGYGSVFPLVWHPECVGRGHVIGMLDRFIRKLVAKKQEAGEGEISFETMESVAKSFRHRIK